MKKKNKQKRKAAAPREQAPVKGNLTALSDYFGSYLTALEIVTARH